MTQFCYRIIGGKRYFCIHFYFYDPSNSGSEKERQIFPNTERFIILETKVVRLYRDSQKYDKSHSKGKISVTLIYRNKD